MIEIIEDQTMIERVAEAIWMENRPAGAPAFDELDFLDQGRVKMIARACIKAMKNPTEEMIRAGEKMETDTSCEVFWNEMIDAALKED